MIDPDKLENEITKMKEDTNKWRMGLDFKSLDQKGFESAMQTKYALLFKNSKTLFKNVLENKVDQKNLSFLLSMMRQVYSKQTTPAQADLIVGQQFTNKYVKPLVKDNKDKSNSGTK